MNIKQLIEELTGRAEGSKCPCASCALRRKAMKTDSVTEIRRLALISCSFATIHENMVNLSNSLSENPDTTLESEMKELEEIGYPVSAKLVKEYLAMVKRAQELIAASKEEDASKEEEVAEKV